MKNTYKIVDGKPERERLFMGPSIDGGHYEHIESEYVNCDGVGGRGSNGGLWSQRQ
jgi:hypothetical protein